MDLNELLHAHQLAVMQAGAEGDPGARDGHFVRVAEYAERVRQLRAGHAMPGLADPAIPPLGPETIIYGTYAGLPEAAPSAQPLDGWEDEGGSLEPADPIEAIAPEGAGAGPVVREYRVGPHIYQDLGLALTEHMRRLSAAAPPDPLDPHPESD